MTRTVLQDGYIQQVQLTYCVSKAALVLGTEPTEWTTVLTNAIIIRHRKVDIVSITVCVYVCVCVCVCVCWNGKEE